MNNRFGRFVRQLAIVLLAGIGVVGSASAALLDRGGGLIYDDDLNITWLQDANYALTSGHDADGQMNWVQAMTWAENLVYGGFDDWRLPTALNQDGTGPCGPAFNCTGSEMGHLYYTELGNVAGDLIINAGLFANLQFDAYWSGTEARDPDAAWNFLFPNNGDGGIQGFDLKDHNVSAWAVRPGDVGAGAVSEPASLVLLALGLLGLGWSRRKKA